MTLDYHRLESKLDWRFIPFVSCWISFSLLGLAISSLSFFARWIIPLDPIDWSSFLWGWIMGTVAIVAGSACGYAAARVNSSFLVKSFVSLHNYFLLMFYGLIFFFSLSFCNSLRGVFTRLALFLTPLASLAILALIFNRHPKSASQNGQTTS